MLFFSNDSRFETIEYLSFFYNEHRMQGTREENCDGIFIFSVKYPRRYYYSNEVISTLKIRDSVIEKYNRSFVNFVYFFEKIYDYLEPPDSKKTSTFVNYSTTRFPTAPQYLFYTNGFRIERIEASVLRLEDFSFIVVHKKT